MKRINISIDYPDRVEINGEILAELLNRSLDKWTFDEYGLYGVDNKLDEHIKLLAEPVFSIQNGRNRFVGITLTQRLESENEES